jgi:hypothetical protein
MNYDKNAHCYTYKKQSFSDPFLTSVDATYIIHLENNERLPAIEEQLRHFHPTRDVFIVYNKGFKKCDKVLKQQDSMNDLKDVNLNILQHSIDNNYSTILILEDDFQFSEEILSKNTSNEVNRFLIENSGNELIYYLGCLPTMNYFTSLNHVRLFISLGAHACIYTHPVKEKLIKNAEKVMDWDGYLNSNPFIPRYRYKTPLCYQIFPPTENQSNWENGMYFGKYIVYIMLFVISRLGLDKEPEPGFTHAYYLSYFFSYIGVFVLLYLVYKFFLSSFRLIHSLKKTGMRLFKRMTR